MNELVKDLLKQSTYEILGVPQVDQKKFAKLIVAECGIALSPMLRDMVSRGQAYDLIKQHFGVEE